MTYLLKRWVNKMRDLFVVAKFTIKDMIKRKSFIISTLLILLIIVVAFNIPNVINMLKGEDADTRKCKASYCRF